MENNNDARDLASIVRIAQQGDSDAFEQLVTRFQVMAIAIGYAMLGDQASAQDVAQEAFIEAYLCLPALREPAAFPGWFRRIVVKQCDRLYRRARPVATLENSQVVDDGADPASIFEKQVARRAVRHAVDDLPPAQRLVAGLFYLVGLSQQEIMACLALPASTVKKRLFDARKTLRARMSAWNEVTKMPLDEDGLTGDMTKNRVMFFVALYKHDLARVMRLLDQSPELMTAPFVWDAGPYGHYWPVGYTAMHWAAATDDQHMVDMLLAHGAPVDVLSSVDKRTALHVSALMGRPDIVSRLLDAGADTNVQDKYGHTPLHLAAWANQPSCVDILVYHGATPGVRDSGNRTPADWAAIRGSRTILDELVTPVGKVKPSVTPDRSTRVFETGLKIIDLCAPFVRGGINALFSPRSGVGKMVTVNGLIHIMATQYQGHTIWLGLEHDLFVREGLELAIRNAGLAYAVDVVTAHQNEPESYLKATDNAIAAAHGLSTREQPVMLVVASPVALADGVMKKLRTAARDAPANEITVLIYGNETVGAEPDVLTKLDAAQSFDHWRTQQGLHPGIDVLNSRSILLEQGDVDVRHIRLARETRRLLRRHQDLTATTTDTLRGLDGLPIKDDTVLVKRACLMHDFLTQPMPDVELFFQRPAVYVPLVQTLDGCEAILAGRLDHLDEDMLRYKGAIDPALMQS